MPDYVLSRTSPPANIYERKINLGYGLKVDTSDAPTQAGEAGKTATQSPEPNKGKKMNEQVVELADAKPAVFADGSAFENGSVNADELRRQIEAKAAEEAKNRPVQAD